MTAARGKSIADIDVGEIVTEVAALLRAGADPKHAWAQVLSRQPAGSPGAEAATLIAAGEPVEQVLEWLAPQLRFPGPLLGAAAGTRLAQRLGSSTADVLDECVETVTSLQDSAAERHASLAGPRSTMRVLLALPLFALFLFSGAGVNGIEQLLTTGPGWACLVVGAVFLGFGHRWVQKLIAAAEQGGDLK